jgi:PleD family two-component response regulator
VTRDLKPWKEDLFHAVDGSMYEAKDAGRNLVRLQEPRRTIATQVL